MSQNCCKGLINSLISRSSFASFGILLFRPILGAIFFLFFILYWQKLKKQKLTGCVDEKNKITGVSEFFI